MMNTIQEGCCVSIMQKIEDNFIDLTITSPPYDDLRNYNGYDFNFEKIADELFRITKEGGVVVWVVGDATIKGSETGTSFKQALYFMEIGFNLHDTMIYHKDNPPPVGGNNRYYQGFEYMFVFSKGKPKTFNPLARKRRNKWNDNRTVRYRGVTRNQDGEFVKKEIKVKKIVKLNNVWKYMVGGGISTSDKEAFKHPAIFPEQLANDHILSWSNPNDIVLDPMCGSGTTCKMAKINNRQFIGIDISPEYCKIAKERLDVVEYEEFQKQLFKVKGMTSEEDLIL